jgi:hypothetical protein
MFVDIIDDLVGLAKSFFSIFESEITTPWKNDMVTLMDFDHVCVKPINEILHFLLSVKRAESIIVINKIVSRVKMRSEAVAIVKDGGQNLLFISEVLLVWSPQEIVRLVGLPNDSFAFVMSGNK